MTVFQKKKGSSAMPYGLFGTLIKIMHQVFQDYVHSNNHALTKKTEIHNHEDECIKHVKENLTPT